jgi:hypothetical protein
MTIDEKSEAIRKGVMAIAQELNGNQIAASGAAVGMLATACALLTSTSKEEREEGKRRVRQWRSGNAF